MGGGKERYYNDSSDRGLFSHPSGYAAAGHYSGSCGGYPPQGYPQQAYPSAGYPPQGGYPCPPQGGYPQSGYPPPGGYPPAAYPPPGGYPSAGYLGPSAPYHSGHGSSMGMGMGGLLAGGAAAYGALHPSHGSHNLGHGGYYGYGHGHGHGHGKFKHGKFGKHGGYGGKFKKWK